MSFNETLSHHDQPPETSGELAERARQQARQELSQLNQEVLWEGVPTEAQQFLQANCSTDSLPSAISEVRALLASDPSVLDDPELAVFELEECIAKAEIAAKSEMRDTETNRANDAADRNEQHRTTIDSLRERISGNLTGSDKEGQLKALIAQVNKQSGFPEAERLAALKHLGQIQETLLTMKGVFEDSVKRAVFADIVNDSVLDLGALTVGDTFAPVLSKVETAGIFSGDDRKRLRAIVTASDLSRETLRTTVDPETGKSSFVYSAEKPLEFRPGVKSYPDAEGRELMTVTLDNGQSHSQNISGMSLQDRTALAEYYQIWQITEASGISDILHNSFGLAFDPFSESRIDWSNLNRTRQIVDALLGGWAGSDGKIFSAEGSGKFIAWQMQWLSRIGDSAQDNVDIQITNDSLMQLGIRDANGKLNLEVIRAFGSFTQEQYGKGEPSFQSLHEHLFGIFPQFVRRPAEA